MQTLAEKVKVISPLTAAQMPSRYQWLSLPLAEPNLGIPDNTGVHVLTSNNTGERGWTGYTTPLDFFVNSITASDLIAYKFRAGTNNDLIPGVTNSFILGNDITGGISNFTFVTNLCSTGKIFNTTGGTVLFDALTAYSFQAGLNNKKTGAADSSTFIIGNNITAYLPDYTYVSNLTSKGDIAGNKLFTQGGDAILDTLVVTSLTALSAITQITDTRTVILLLTSLSADDIYSAGNITAAKTVSGMRGQFYELSASRFIVGQNSKYSPIVATDNSYILGSNITAGYPNFTFVENLCAVKDLYVVGNIYANTGNFNLDAIKTKSLTATNYFIAGNNNSYKGAAVGDLGYAFILGNNIQAGYANTTYVNNLCATNRVTSLSLSGRSITADGLSARIINIGSNNRINAGTTNVCILGNNITAGISDATYVNQLTVIGDLTVLGNLSASSIGGAADLTETIRWVADNRNTVESVATTVTTQSAYWTEPVRKFEYIYGNPDLSYSGMAPASADSLVNAQNQPFWTITRLYYTLVGSVSAVDKAYNVTWGGRASTTYARIWSA